MAEPTATRFFFDSIEAAAEGLLTVLEDARVCTVSYRFGALSAQQVLVSGLLLEGQITDISAQLEDLAGVVSEPM